MTTTNENMERLKTYYGKIIKSTKDLKTKACCCDSEPISPAIRQVLGSIDPEIVGQP